MCSRKLSFISCPAFFLFRSDQSTTRPLNATTATCSLAGTERRMQLIRGVSEIADKYDCILLDQFGVIHDGQAPYPRALEAIHMIHKKGLKIVVLSNSSRQSKHAAKKLTQMGVDGATIHGIVTSGQLALSAIGKEMGRKPASRVLHFNWCDERGTISSEDHDIREVPPMTRTIDDMRLPSLENIDIIVAHGTDGIMTSPTVIQPMPVKALRNLCIEIATRSPDVPFYCANPDMVTVDGPKLRVMPGTLAKDFEDAGGTCVMRMGKPDAVAYDAAVELLGAVDRSRILAIGDSLGHDILGAANAGIDSLYIAGGINADQFRINPADGFKEFDCSWEWDESVLKHLQEKEARQLAERKPTYVCPFFRW